MIVRIYTGQDGQTHFEDLPLPAEESHNVALQAGANLTFRCFPADYFSDWHTAPRRQYIFILAGQMEIGIGDGSTRRFGLRMPQRQRMTTRLKTLFQRPELFVLAGGINPIGAKMAEEVGHLVVHPAQPLGPRRPVYAGPAGGA
jgi:hypothetical protein